MVLGWVRVFWGFDSHPKLCAEGWGRRHEALARRDALIAELCQQGVQKFVDVAAMECLCDMPVVKQPVRPSPPPNLLLLLVLLLLTCHASKTLHRHAQLSGHEREGTNSLIFRKFHTIITQLSSHPMLPYPKQRLMLHAASLTYATKRLILCVLRHFEGTRF